MQTPAQGGNIWTNPAPAAGHTACPWPSYRPQAKQQWPNSWSSAGSTAPQPWRPSIPKPNNATAAHRSTNPRPDSQLRITDFHDRRQAAPATISSLPQQETPAAHQRTDDVFQSADFDWADFDLQCVTALKGPLGFQKVEPPLEVSSEVRDRCLEIARADDQHCGAQNTVATADGGRSSSEELLLSNCKTVNAGIQVHR